MECSCWISCIQKNTYGFEFFVFSGRTSQTKLLAGVLVKKKPAETQNEGQKRPADTQNKGQKRPAETQNEGKIRTAECNEGQKTPAETQNERQKRQRTQSEGYTYKNMKFAYIINFW